jgi:hypothetical protein
MSRLEADAMVSPSVWRQYFRNSGQNFLKDGGHAKN